ncbi:MAG: glycosyltransferase family 87 protein, partial [Terriglobales bacterium]
MGARSILEKQLFWVIAAAFCAAGTWLYADRVVIPEQIAYAAAHGTLGGIHSDLYPRWVGARELLLHHRDPYTIEVTREIQKGFYGRVLDPDQPGATENYQQGFYYPVYVAFLLAPTLDLPFDIVRKVFFYVLLGLTVISVPLWLYVVRWRVSPWGKVTILGLMLGSIPIMQGLKLQQMTLLVVALLAGAMALLVANRQVPAGILLALATIKPQLAWPLVAWLLLWTLADWRVRRKFVLGFGLVMVLLLAGAEIILPGWWRMFA